MILNTKISIYDFCGTIVDIQTADLFIEYIIKNENVLIINLFDNLRKIFVKLRFIEIFDRIIHKFNKNFSSFNKFILLYEIKNISKNKIEVYAKKFYDNVIHKHFNYSVLNILLSDIENNYNVIIISSSYEPILKHFTEEYGIKYLITNEFSYKNNRFVGKLKNKDCYGNNKVKFLIEKFNFLNNKDNIEIKSYSDSISDIPILNFSNKPYVVTKNSGFDWVVNNHYKTVLI